MRNPSNGRETAQFKGLYSDIRFSIGQLSTAATYNFLYRV